MYSRLSHNFHFGFWLLRVIQPATAFDVRVAVFALRTLRSEKRYVRVWENRPAVSSQKRICSAWRRYVTAIWLSSTVYGQREQTTSLDPQTHSETIRNDIGSSMAGGP